VLSGYISSVVATVSAALLITIWWKISFHTLALGGIIGSLIALSLRFEADLQYFIMASLFFTGLVSAARLRLGAHTPLQIITGFFLGLIVVFLFVFFGLNF